MQNKNFSHNFYIQSSCKKYFFHRNGKDLSDGNKILVVGSASSKPLYINVNFTNIADDFAYFTRVIIEYDKEFSFTEVCFKKIKF